MAERLRRMSDEELGAALAGTSRLVAVPPIDVASIVLARITAADVVPLRRRRRTVRRASVLAAAVVLLVGGAAAAGRLGVPGLRIVFGHETHAPVAAPTNVPTITLAEARGKVAFDVLTPHGMGLGPARVHVDQLAPGGRITLTYPPSGRFPRSRFIAAGVLITEFEGHIDDGFFKKVVLPGGHIATPEVNGNPAVWFFGPPHEVTFFDRDGIPLETTRLAGNTLVWAVGPVTIRLECNCTEHSALAIGRSMR
jgi:hypothetical protein